MALFDPKLYSDSTMMVLPATMSGGPGTTVGYAELEKCIAAFAASDRSEVNVSASGYARVSNTVVKLNPIGWMDILADGDTTASPAFVVEVIEVVSVDTASANRAYSVFDQLQCPTSMLAYGRPSIVLVGHVAGTDVNTAANPTAMKRVRIWL